DAHLRLGPAEPAQRRRILGIDVLGDEPRDQLALWRPQRVRRPVELVRLGGRNPHEQRSLVNPPSRSRHRGYLNIKKISPSASATRALAATAGVRAPCASL